MIKLDMSKFEKSIRQLEKENVKAAKQALYLVGVAIVNKAEPLVPIKEGNLVGSVSISVGKDLKLFQSKTSSSGQSSGPPPISGAIDTELRVAYNMPYAYRLHEGDFNPGPVSKQKRLIRPIGKWLPRAMAQLDIPALLKRFYKLPGVIQ